MPYPFGPQNLSRSFATSRIPRCDFAYAGDQDDQGPVLGLSDQIRVLSGQKDAWPPTGLLCSGLRAAYTYIHTYAIHHRGLSSIRQVDYCSPGLGTTVYKKSRKGPSPLRTFPSHISPSQPSMGEGFQLVWMHKAEGQTPPTCLTCIFLSARLPVISTPVNTGYRQQCVICRLPPHNSRAYDGNAYLHAFFWTESFWNGLSWMSPASDNDAQIQVACLSVPVLKAAHWHGTHHTSHRPLCVVSVGTNRSECIAQQESFCCTKSAVSAEKVERS